MEEIAIKFSIIIPTFNSANVIGNVLESIISQKENKIEIIIMDNMSTDETITIVSSYQAKLKNDNNIRIYIFSEKDEGCYDAMNKSLNHITGNWILFLGSDDMLIPNSLRNAKKYLKYDNVIYYGNSYRPSENKLYDGKFDKLKLCTKNINHQCILYPSIVFSKNRYNTKYKILADYNLNIQLFGNKDFTYKYIPILITYYEDIKKGMSGLNRDEIFYADKPLIIKTNFGILYYIYLKTRYGCGNLIRKICQ
ncbi:MAG: hypothetical protein A2066_00605 [Bacteroidetes bacterium GWB2_41_8]|nr:MAG: hypothetical protein A2066_00605 [Bacteroidetes bacterium GWB2_41_8]